MIEQLDIVDYETFIILGNNDFEKVSKRKVIISISLRFSEKNKACDNDKIEKTVCYSKLINFLNNILNDEKFNLVEKVAKFLYDKISVYLNNKSILKRVKVIKPSPLVKNLKYSSFICSDW